MPGLVCPDILHPGCRPSNIDQSSVVELLECGSPNNLRSLLILSHQKTGLLYLITSILIGSTTQQQ
ncbi:hypothetical protein T4D_2887 [Trichinella pseudospiralis]|uniref:Uncharacterized protein n=1 Tax=Trichinella pseudospiralis TaxID=6337 RepID=A0A0V1FP55_TRIPS|nr:hypothetical protein T4D_2887 [Trichinella pseudospiralis]